MGLVRRNPKPFGSRPSDYNRTPDLEVCEAVRVRTWYEGEGTRTIKEVHVLSQLSLLKINSKQEGITSPIEVDILMSLAQRRKAH